MATQTATVEVKLTANQQNLKRGLDGAQKSLKNTAKAGAKAQKDLQKGGKGIQESFRRASQSIAAIQGPLGPVAGRITSLGTIIGNVGLKVAALTVGFAALTFAVRGMVGTISRAEQQFLKLEAILKATGSAAGLTLEEIEDLAREIGVNTLASTQKVRDAAGILLTFKSISGDTFKTALRLTQDLAEVGFGDVKQGAIQLGKALEEPIVGLGALRRVGVSFTESQKEVIKVLAMTGRKAEAQDIILKALNDQVGNSGKKAAEGLAGAIDSVVEKFTMFIEESKTGRIIVDGLTASLNALAGFFGDFEKSVERLNTENKLVEFIEDTKKKIEELDAGNNFIMGLDEVDHVSDEVNRLMGEVAKAEEKLANMRKEHAKKKKIADEGLKKRQEAEKKELTDIEKVAEKTLNKQILQQERLRENVAKTTKELRVLTEARKLEDALRAKLGDSPMAQKEINRLVQENMTNLESQIELTMKFEKVQLAVKSTVQILQTEFDNLSKNLAKAFVTGQTEGLKFKNILQSLGQQLVKTILDLVIFNQLKAGVEIIGGKVGNAVLNRIFGGGAGSGATGEVTSDAGFRSTGGAMSAGMPKIVGERGPELFVPNQAGRVIPSSLTPNAMGGGSIVVNQSLNFATGIQNTVRAEIISMMPQIQNQTVSAVAEARMRGGKFAKAFS